MKCPNCGSEDDLYRRADAKWNPAHEAWLVDDDSLENEIDCTNCDHIFYKEDLKS